MPYKPYKVVEATVDGIRFLYDGVEVEVDYNASNGDVVRLTIEPLEVKVTDGFRAAVKKACNCDSSSGGGSGSSTGGGVLVVHANEVTRALDKTWQEIHDADFAVLKLSDFSDGDFVRFAITSQVEEAEGVYAAIFVYVGKVPTPYVCITDSPDGYPVVQESGGGGDGE